MAFTATINSINFQDDQWSVGVTFNDSVSGWTANKTYSFPVTETQANAVAQITADGTNYKNNLTALTTLQSKVGTVLTI